VTLLQRNFHWLVPEFLRAFSKSCQLGGRISRTTGVLIRTNLSRDVSPRFEQGIREVGNPRGLDFNA